MEMMNFLRPRPEKIKIFSCVFCLNFIIIAPFLLALSFWRKKKRRLFPSFSASLPFESFFLFLRLDIQVVNLLSGHKTRLSLSTSRLGFAAIYSLNCGGAPDKEGKRRLQKRIIDFLSFFFGVKYNFCPFLALLTLLLAKVRFGEKNFYYHFFLPTFLAVSVNEWKI